MAGFAGFLRRDGAPADPTPLPHMVGRLTHRGPDGGGLFYDGALALGHCRLAALDPQDEAGLPLTRGDVTLACSGTFYAFRQQRERLEAKGYRFTTWSDAEVVLTLYLEHGDDFVDQLRGKFAFALWDSRRRRLLLGRDPAGGQPLFYYVDGRRLVFASELKGLLTHPDVPRRPDWAALTPVLAYGYAPSPATCFEHLTALPPGQLLVAHDGQITAPARSFGLRLTSTAGRGEPAQWTERLRETLREAVRARLVSAVPVGALLSGGLDSALVVALMREVATSPVRTFSLGFAGAAGPLDHAAQVAARLGTEHTAWQLDPPAAAPLWAEMVWHLEQPCGDPLAVGQLLLSRLVRADVGVALTGDGADELFAGYDRHVATKLVVGPWLGWLGGRRWRPFAAGARQGLPEAYLSWLRQADSELLASVWGGPAAADGDEAVKGHFLVDDPRDWLSQALDLDFRTAVPDSLLLRADRLGLAASLELRSPFLDAAMVKLAGEMPSAVKVRGRQAKFVLREAARGLLPADLLAARPPRFAVPVGDWLRTVWLDEARAVLLDPATLRRGGVQAAGVERALADHAAGRRDHGRLLLALCLLEHWFRRFIDPVEVSPPAAS